MIHDPKKFGSSSGLVLKTLPRGIYVFYPSLKVGIKMVSVNMKSGTMNMIFVTIFRLKIKNKIINS